jgi:L-asparaginase II
VPELPGWTAKRGAEGLFCAAGPGGIGVAVKSEDGSTRPLRPALAALLQLLGRPLEAFRQVECRNSRGDAVGIIEAA